MIGLGIILLYHFLWFGVGYLWHGQYNYDFTLIIHIFFLLGWLMLFVAAIINLLIKKN